MASTNSTSSMAYETFEATVSAPVNIAVIKYWGKRDTKLILPTNSSLSVTLDQDHLRSTTTSRASPSFEKDRLWLNGKEEEIKQGGRLAVCLAELRRLRKQEDAKDSSKLGEYNLHIASYNNFPTAAGLASSASGFAALVYSVATLYKLPQNNSQLSAIARQGSGSACRSLFGGFVAWEAGTDSSGSDSLAIEVAPQSHWPDMHAIICVVSDHKKGTSSTSGMQRTVETSTLLQHRIKEVVPKRMKDISKAILERDFDTFARITMADSNSFHAVALDTEPPIFYMNDVSRGLIQLIVEYNKAAVESSGKVKAAYTYDAGPNCVIYTLKENVPEILNLVNRFFPPAEEFVDKQGILNGAKSGSADLPAAFNEQAVKAWDRGSVKSIIHTRVGDGPRTYGREESLLGEDGIPLTLN